MLFQKVMFQKVEHSRIVGYFLYTIKIFENVFLNRLRRKKRKLKKDNRQIKLIEKENDKTMWQ